MKDQEILEPHSAGSSQEVMMRNNGAIWRSNGTTECEADCIDTVHGSSRGNVSNSESEAPGNQHPHHLIKQQSDGTITCYHRSCAPRGSAFAICSLHDRDYEVNYNGD